MQSWLSRTITHEQQADSKPMYAWLSRLATVAQRTPFVVVVGGKVEHALCPRRDGDQRLGQREEDHLKEAHLHAYQTSQQAMHSEPACERKAA